MRFEDSGNVPFDDGASFQRPEPGIGEGRAVRISQFAKILAVVRKRKWALIGSVAATVILVLILTLLATPQYTASATIEIQRESRNFTNVEGAQAEQAATVDQEFYQTQYGLLGARSLADRVSTDLRLQDDAKFFELFKSDKLDDWFENGKLKPNASTRERRLREVGEILLDHLSVSPERLSRLVEISFTSPDPAFSKKIVDAWGRHFIQLTLERRFETTSYARKFLEDRLTQLRVRINESEGKLVDYAAREGIVNVPTGAALAQDSPAGTNERSLVAENLATLNRELAKATVERVQAESRLNTAGTNVAEALENQGIQDLRSSRAQLVAQYAKMMQQFEPNYPPARALQSQIQQLDRSISREEARVGSTLRETYRASVAREKELGGRVAALKSGMLDLRRRSIQYNIFQRDVDTNRQLYDALLQRYKEIGVAGGVGVNNIAIVDAAQLPQLPSSPKLLINLLVALVLGLGIGAGVLFLLEQFDEGVADPAEIETTLGVPLLGTIPKSDDGDIFAALADPKESVSEAYFSLQTALGFATDHGFPRTLAVTSSKPAEGKSTSSFALAKSLARPGRKTILIDGDLRSPSIHLMLGLDRTSGVSNYLAGSDDVDSLIQPTAYPDLFAMAAGPQPPSAAELLASDRLQRLLAELRERFDHVIIDAPPVMGIADAPIIGSRVEGSVFVMEAHGTKKGVARVAVARMQAAKAVVMGVILTKFDAKRANYGYGYDYGYGYGYGDQARGASET